MLLQDDDDIHRARLVYLGPPGYTFPFHKPYAWYGLLATNLTVFLTVGALLVGGWGIITAEIMAAIVVTELVWKFVSPDMPARVVLKLAVLDWRRIRPQEGPLPRLSARHIRFSPEITARAAPHRRQLARPAAAPSPQPRPRQMFSPAAAPGRRPTVHYVQSHESYTGERR